MTSESAYIAFIHVLCAKNAFSRTCPGIRKMQTKGQKENHQKDVSSKPVPKYRNHALQ
jgi:hypothetical protein